MTMTLTVSAETDTVSVVVKDSVATDSLSLQRGESLGESSKRHGFFWRAYHFIDRLLSPPRDQRYIDVQNYNWCAMVQVSTKLEMYQIDAGKDNFLLQLTPNPRTRVGPFFGWRFAFFGYNIDLKSIFFSNDDTDISASIYSAAFGLDLFYRRVGGSFNINKLRFKDMDLSDYLHGEPFDGINVGMTRVSFYYIPNFRHYSHQAAFSQTNRQLLSAGSIILGAQYAHNRIRIDGKLLGDILKRYNPTITMPSYIPNGLETSDEVTATVGYGYNWVFHKNWLMASEITGSLGYVLQNDDTEYQTNDQSFTEKVKTQFNRHVALNGSLRFSLLYNNGPWFTGLQGVGFYYQHGNGAMVTRNALGTFYVFVGYNF